MKTERVRVYACDYETTEEPIGPVLDVSENHLRDIPTDVGLPLLRKLDCSDNQLYSLGFVKQFPRLEELYVEGNGLESSARFVVGALCPKIKHVDKTPGSTLRKMVENVSSKIMSHVEKQWEMKFADNYAAGIPQEEAGKVVQQLAESVMKHAPFTKQNQFRQFMVKLTSERLVNDVQRGTYGTPAKKPRLSSPPSSEPEESEILSPEEKLDFTSLKKRSNLPPVADYEPVHFLRCHFGDKEAKKQKMKDNDPADDITKVWHCALNQTRKIPNIYHMNNASGNMHMLDAVTPEKDLGVTIDQQLKFSNHIQNAVKKANRVQQRHLSTTLHSNDKTTSTVATCGGDTVCLIDCDTGRVMRRFKQQKEQFFFVAWTTLNMESESGREWPTNVLAVGGFNAHIRLLLPNQLVCYAELGNGRPNRAVQCYFISALLFHPDEPTWLFSGTSDTTVTLWDIGTPQGQKYEVECSQLLILHSPGEGVLNMVFSQSTGHLVAGCEEGCYAWKIGQSTSVKKHRDPTLELVLPGVKDKMVDGMTMVSDNLVASKPANEGRIFLWTLSTTLSSHRRHSKTAVTIQPLLVVDWSTTDVEFINPGARNGLLACGDDDGRIWLYNLEQYTTARKTPPAKQTATPSRLLEWPECLTDGRRSQEQKMTDLVERVKELVVNCVCVSGSQEYIVGGTDNNLVCIWKKIA
ncbi:hypothetical protein NP493_401g04030 [Ridgeia piscesae]|uniref:Leucine-rich repeat and WD repeat-containing protein 1 n=1 Tax=Ridgeia piscesae TaxID=27915 RepID=A0AAD9L121_RIDPI|nr:hypothetical protein NP493_401g04030 [Ridgeia piscesae]